MFTHLITISLCRNSTEDKVACRHRFGPNLSVATCQKPPYTVVFHEICDELISGNPSDQVENPTWGF